MPQLPKERRRPRAVNPHYCNHPKLISIWKYKRFPDKAFSKCLVCGGEMVTTRLVSSTTVAPPPDTTRQGSSSRRL
jgi:hypothetical protein